MLTVAAAGQATVDEAERESGQQQQGTQCDPAYFQLCPAAAVTWAAATSGIASGDEVGLATSLVTTVEARNCGRGRPGVGQRGSRRRCTRRRS